MDKLFEENFFAIKASDNRQYMFGAGVQILDIQIREYTEMISSSMREEHHHQRYTYSPHLKTPLWFAITKAFTIIKEKYDIDMKRKLYGQITFYKDDEIVGGGSSSDIIDYINYMTDAYPEKLYKAISIDDSKYSPFDKEGNYTTLIL